MAPQNHDAFYVLVPVPNNLSKIDWKTEGLNEEFTYFNPQEASSCGCGESIMFKPRAQENEIRAVQIT